MLFLPREEGQGLVERIQDPDRHALPKDRRQNGHPEIDLPRLVAELEGTVLGEAMLGDIQVSHDLDARGDGRLKPLGDRYRLMQDAVQAESDPKNVLVGFEVNVGNSPPNRVDHDQVHEADHGGPVCRGAKFRGIIPLDDVCAQREFDLPDLVLNLREETRDG